MTGFDYLVLTTLGVSALLGLIRGLIKEVLSLFAYVFAFVIAVWWGPALSNWLVIWLDNTLLRTVAGYGSVFIVVLLLVGLVNITLAALIKKTGLTPADHGLGAMFGLLRGILLILTLVGLAGYTELPQESWWVDARLSSAAVKSVQQIKQLLPPSLASWLPY
ncbi:CvpA family protein [Alcaligenaceae bacterium]|nr:CvpA family protein [Alcaligenaceae bacterium]